MHTRFVRAALALVFSCLAACNDDPSGDTCPDVQGVFVASYQWLDGSCGAFNGNAITVKSDDKGTVTKVENRLSDTVMTQYIFKGCTLGITQSVETMGAKTSQISGDLAVLEETELSGKMMRTEYNPDGAVRCNAVYDARYLRTDRVVGGAVQHAATSDE